MLLFHVSYMPDCIPVVYVLQRLYIILFRAHNYLLSYLYCDTKSEIVTKFLQATVESAEGCQFHNFLYLRCAVLLLCKIQAHLLNHLVARHVGSPVLRDCKVCVIGQGVRSPVRDWEGRGVFLRE
jgi:hypothetical protein